MSLRKAIEDHVAHIKEQSSLAFRQSCNAMLDAKQQILAKQIMIVLDAQAKALEEILEATKKPIQTKELANG